MSSHQYWRGLLEAMQQIFLHQAQSFAPGFPEEDALHSCWRAPLGPQPHAVIVRLQPLITVWTHEGVLWQTGDFFLQWCWGEERQNQNQKPKFKKYYGVQSCIVLFINPLKSKKASIPFSSFKKKGKGIWSSWYGELKYQCWYHSFAHKFLVNTVIIKTSCLLICLCKTTFSLFY